MTCRLNKGDNHTPASKGRKKCESDECMHVEDVNIIRVVIRDT